MTMPNGGASTAAVRRHDRRRCVRRKVAGSGEMIAVDLGPMESGLLLDISARGASVQGLKPLRPGVRISLKFRLPGSQVSVQPTYEVVWADADGKVGLQFLYIAEREQRLLEQWAAAYLPQPETPAEQTAESPTAEPPAMTLEQELARVIEQACGYTSADGGAIAIREEQGIVCRANCGNAPDVGVVLELESGLSGACIRTGAAVDCADALHDPRVDAIAARQLGLRSALIVPIKLDDSVQGLIEVLSSRPRAFTPAHVQSLERLAEIVGFLMGPPVVPVKQPPAEVASPTAQAAASDETPPASEVPAAAADAAGIIELIEPELKAAALVVKEQATRTNAVTAQSSAEPAEEVVSPAMTAPLPSLENQAEPRLRVSVFAAVAIVCGLLLAAIWFLGPRWLSRGNPRPEAPAVTTPGPHSETHAGTPATQMPAVNTDSTPLRVPPQIMFERIISRPDPEYPEDARRERIGGVVMLDVIVGTDGQVERAAPISGPPILAFAAAKAVREWRYRAYIKDGKPMRIETVVTVQFPHS